MSDITNVEVPWTGDDIPCPICGERVAIKVRVIIKSVHVRRSGTEDMRPVISTNVDSDADGAIISHNCSKKGQS